MRALRIEDTDAGPRARLTEVALSALTAGDVVIAAHYSSLNYKDAMAVTGAGKIARQRPLNAGIDVAGVVEHSEDARFSAGDPVSVTGWLLSETRDGGLAEYVRVPGDCVTPLPDGLSLWEAMALGTAGFTAAMAIKRLRDNFQSPEHGPMLVTGAGGGVGMFAIEMLAQAGFEPVAVTRRVEALTPQLRTLGAVDVIAPDNLDTGGKPLAGERFGGAIDALGGETLAAVLAHIRQFGNVAAIGLAASPKLEATVLPFILRGVSLLGINSVECPVAWREAIWRDLAGPLKPAHLADIAHETVGLDEVADVCDAIIAGEHTGRTVVAIRR
ncbi:acryloyl-CoA reductase [Salinisphaera sp. Q1T1-3]|uniref:acrylyl-CoA reductase family protein n=1 Tax=Salinisphaera sp. Q1T1-3 TaxID=2321229 RepID=UPI000E753783|nr:acryloyl-CoA reductase [Salinisphaera sp. Q1T1-3]RJS93319.1 acryloyl-CoA reductase [Salinisphaera sp. Q1T1-3]